MATVPTALDPAPGDKNSASKFDAGVRDVLNWLLDDYPRVHAWDSSGFSIPNSVSTLIPFNSETYDTDNMHDVTTNNSRITFQTTGLYRVEYLLTINLATYSALDLNIRQGANGAAGGGTSIRTQGFSQQTPTILFPFQQYFTAGQYVEAFVQQTSGGARTLSGTSQGTRVYAQWLARS